MIYARVDQLMLYQMRGAQDVGYYAVAVKISEVFNIIPVAFMASIFPLFSRYFVRSAQTLNQAYRLTAKFLMALIIPIAAGATIFSGQIITLLYKDAFLPSAPAFVILMWSEVFIFAGVVNNRLLVSVNRQRIDFAYTATAAAANIALNIVLIPRYGILGASCATLAAYAAGPVMNCVLKSIRSYGIIMFGQMLKPILASGVMMVCLYYARTLTLAVGICIGIVVYAACMVLIRGISWEETRLIFSQSGD
jgi:O-antigen/teichoic acid export membrane protein